MTYAEKLKDPRWLTFREDFLWRHRQSEDSPACCYQCGDEKPLHLHHRRYIDDREPWEYEDTDILILCDGCHKYIHAQEKRTRAFIIGLKPHEAMDWARMMDALENFRRDHRQCTGSVLGRLAHAAEEMDLELVHHREVLGGGCAVHTLLESLKFERDRKLWMIDRLEAMGAKQA